MDTNPPTPPERTESTPGQPTPIAPEPPTPLQQPQAYQQPPAPPPSPYPPPPPQQKKGFNWLACCGITCLVLIIIGGLIGYGCYRMMRPMIAMGIELDALRTEVANTDSTTIRSSAVTVESTALGADPKSYQGQWLAVEGEIMSLEFSGEFSAGDFSSGEATNYVLSGDISVMDISQAPAVGTAGDRIRAYGKVYTLEISEMPFFGQLFEEAAKQDPSLPKAGKIVFFITKDVELAGSAAPSPPRPKPEGATDGSTGGWIK